MRRFVFLYACLPALAGEVVFLEAAAAPDTRRPEIGEKMPLYRPASPAAAREWLRFEGAQRALRLNDSAWDLVQQAGNPQRQPRPYYVALVKGGNHAAVGLKLEESGTIREYPRLAYILLSPEERSFEHTMLHETAHVAMAMLAGGRQLPRADLASIPHSTAALTDRATAFSEGYAIHFETLAAHLHRDPGTRARFHHESARFGNAPYPLAEYFRPAADLATYSQSVARYHEVRENSYAFESAFRGPDYLRVQLEKARDFASLRDASQLLQSEGWLASFFFLWVVRGDSLPAPEVVDQREQRLLAAMQKLFAAVPAAEDIPWRLHLVRVYGDLFLGEREEIHAALHDTSRGVFADRRARELWRRHYLAALRLDLKNLGREEIAAARKTWREQTLADPRALFALPGPQLRCEIPALKVKIEAFGEASPLGFDINTAEEGVLRLLPGLSADQRAKWIEARPFPLIAAFRAAIGVNACAP